MYARGTEWLLANGMCLKVILSERSVSFDGLSGLGLG